MTLFSTIGWILGSVCTAWNVAGLVAVTRTTGRARPAVGGALPPVTILKPLSGADADLEQNLETIFAQDYPDFEIVFGTENMDDPALAVVERLRAKHPDVPTTIVVHRGAVAVNPKVRNLMGMMGSASHDLVLVSDSNVRAPSGYLRDAVETYLADGDRAGVVTNLFSGVCEDGLGGALESVQLAGFCAGGAALPTLVGDPVVIGKSMLFSRTTLDALGGLSRFSHVLAEDYLMGQAFFDAGYRVRIARTVLGSTTRGATLRAFFSRHVRWGMMRWKIRPIAFLAEQATSPLAIFGAVWMALGPWAIAWALAVCALRDVGGWIALRGLRRAWIPLLVSPLREVAMLAVYAIAPGRRHVAWRGNRVRIRSGTFVSARATA